MQMTREDWEDRYRPITSPDGSDLWDDIPPDTPEDRVWTEVDNPEGGYLILAGRVTVNRIANLVTEQPWEDRRVSAAYGEHDADSDFEDDDKEVERDFSTRSAGTGLPTDTAPRDCPIIGCIPLDDDPQGDTQWCAIQWGASPHEGEDWLDVDGDAVITPIGWR